MSGKETAERDALAVSYLRLLPIDWSGLPLTQLVAAATQDALRQILSRGEIVHATHFRVSPSRGSNLQALITFDFWVDATPRLNPVWDEVLRSKEENDERVR